MFVNVLLFLVGLLMLIKGGDWFVDGASSLARRFHLPELLIGATVVSIGTTLPEVMVSVQGAVAGSGGMAYGNAIGSIICNTSLIAALTVAIKPGKTERRSLVVPVCFFFVSALFYMGIAYFAGEFSRITGIILLSLFAIYMVVIFMQMRKSPKEPSLSAAAEDHSEDVPNTEEKKDAKKTKIAKDILLLVIGAALIAVGARLLVDNGTAIAEQLGVPDTVIALTFVALGTSLPELVTAITALAKGHGALSLGNVIGANLFNLVLVSGASTLISPFPVPADSTIGGFPSSLVLDLPVMLGVMLILCIPALIRKKMSRVQGIVLLCIYAAFCVFQFVI